MLVLFAAVLGGNCWAWTQTTSGFSLIDLSPDQSYVRDFINMNQDMTGSQEGQVLANMHTKQLEYHEAAVQREYANLHAMLRASPKVDGTILTSWSLAGVDVMRSKHPAVVDIAPREPTFRHLGKI